MPTEVYHEDKSSETMRFICELYINGQLVARGAGSNKQHAKFEASKNGLNAICSDLYKQWL